PVRERGIANGWIFAGVGAGAGLTPPLITWVMTQYGWRASFWMCAVIGLLAGAVWYVMARDTPAEHPGVSQAELNEISSGLAIAPRRHVIEGSSAVPLTRVLKSKEVWAVTVSYFCYGYTAWIYFSWFFLYLAR